MKIQLVMSAVCDYLIVSGKNTRIIMIKSDCVGGSNV
jgi:hypothetical protein